MIERRRAYAVQSFNAYLYKLGWEKLELDCDLKHAEIAKAVKWKELECLESLQEKEDGIEQRLVTQLRERQRLRALVAECEARLDAKTKSDAFPALHSALLARFHQIVPEEHPHRDYFMKRFLARKENKGSPSDASSDEFSESDEDSVDDNDDLDDAAVEGVDKVTSLPSLPYLLQCALTGTGFGCRAVKRRTTTDGTGAYAVYKRGRHDSKRERFAFEEAKDSRCIFNDDTGRDAAMSAGETGETQRDSLGCCVATQSDGILEYRQRNL